MIVTEMVIIYSCECGFFISILLHKADRKGFEYRSSIHTFKPVLKLYKYFTCLKKAFCWCVVIFLHECVYEKWTLSFTNFTEFMGAKPWKLPLWENERGNIAAVLLGHSNPLIMFLQTGYLVPMENVSVPRPEFSPRQRYKCLWANGRDMPQCSMQGYF